MLEPGQLLARWFGPPYNTWYMGKIDEVNRRRTKSENVSVAFNDTTHGETRGMLIADAESYGAEKLWVLLKGIPIELDGDDENGDDEDARGVTCYGCQWECVQGCRFSRTTGLLFV